MNTEVTKSKGRPVIENSARQQRLAARAARVAAGGEVRKGRPSNPNSARQQRLANRVDGVAVKRGRPKMEKAVEVTA
jgi:hypothetical protein